MKIKVTLNTHLVHRYKRAGGGGWWIAGNYGEVYGIKRCKCGKVKVINCRYRPAFAESSSAVNLTLDRLNTPPKQEVEK